MQPRIPLAKWDGHSVSILIRPEGRMQLRRQRDPLHKGQCFNPHPARRPDATGTSRVVEERPALVSILIRPEGRMQPPWSLPMPICSGVSILIRPEGRMQPRRAAKYPRPDTLGFNPHPARRPDATLDNNTVCARSTVSILIRPEGRMQLCVIEACGKLIPVSILIRPEGRMQPVGPMRTQETQSFNPHPARRPDATRSSVKRSELSLICFNPHPARRPDATRWPHAYSGDSKFQSSSGQKAGCNPEFREAIRVELDLFQSSSGQKAGCNPWGWNQGRQTTCFNPHPARRPDATQKPD